MTNIINSNTMVGKLVAILVALLLVVVLVYPVINTVGGGSTGINIDNEGAEWLKLGYAEGTDFEFVITDDGADVTVGEQTGSLGDMIYYADDGRVIFSRGTTMYLMTTGNDSAVYTFNDSVSVTNSNGTITVYDGSAVIDTASSPAWAYYPDASGEYGFFTNGNLNLLENEPKVAVGSYAGVFAYNDTIVTPDDVDLGLAMDGDYATGDVTWAVSSDEESNDEPSVQSPASQPTMVTMSKYTEISVMGSANPSGATKIGDLYYKLSGSNASLVGYSSSIDWSTFTTIPDTVTYGGKTYTVNSIGANAFKDCTNLALTSLPAGVTSIGPSAFQGCTNLALTELPAGLTSIKTNTFNGCTNLALTSLPNGLTAIYDSAFKDCTNLALTSLPSGITNIDMNTFQNCTNLALTSLPSGVTGIAGSAFQGCTNLALTSLPSGVMLIANRAFQDCTNLALTSLPSGVKTINAYAFQGCTNLALTSLPNGLTTIYDSAFQDCTSLALTSLPSGITDIKSSAFQGCTNLALTSLPSGVKSIGTNTFSGCTNLALTSLPSGVTSIGPSAFQGCTNLALTSIPADVTSIGGGAFKGCSGIKSMIFLGSPTIGKNAFFNTGIKEVLNFGETEITTTSYGLNADSVQDYIGALGYVAPTHIHEGSSDSSGYNMDSVSMAVLKIIPIILMVCILLVLVMPMIQSKMD